MEENRKVTLEKYQYLITDLGQVNLQDIRPWLSFGEEGQEKNYTTQYFLMRLQKNKNYFLELENYHFH